MERECRILDMLESVVGVSANILLADFSKYLAEEHSLTHPRVHWDKYRQKAVLVKPTYNQLGNQGFSCAGDPGEQDKGMVIVNAYADFYQCLFVLPCSVKKIGV